MKKRYWLRGGMVGLVLGVILDLWLLTQGACVGLNADGTSICPTKLSDIFLIDLKMTPVYFHFIVVITLFLVGIIIGWLYGKIKNRNKGI